MIDYYEPKLDVTLLGCGFLGGYYVGALYLLQQIWPKKPFNRICGASCGGLIGALILAGVSLELAMESAMDIVRQLHASIRSPALLRDNSIDSLLEKKLELLFPKNAHRLCSHRLGLSLTKLWSMENTLVSQFSSRRELIDAVRAGCFIPLWSGSLKAPTYRGEQFIDGAYSDNCPRFQHAHPDDIALGRESPTARCITISPFASCIDVAPRDPGPQFRAKFFGNVYAVNWRNVVRTLHAMLPFGVDTYYNYLVEGHRDMKEYVLLNCLVKCPDCWRQTVAPRTGPPESVIESKACLACLKLLEKVDSLKLPKSITDLCSV